MLAVVVVRSSSVIRIGEGTPTILLIASVTTQTGRHYFEKGITI